jgi:excisionase family DNA binding protein
VSDDLSVAEAASVLGVSDGRVRKLLRDGALPGRHVGRAWVVPAEAVADMAGRQLGAGRPLAPRRAWALVDMLDGGQAAWLGPVARSQVRAQIRHLEGGDQGAWRAALRGREDRLAVSGHRSAIARLAETKDVWLAGPAAARRANADVVVPDPIPEFYISAERWELLRVQLILHPATGRPAAYVWGSPRWTDTSYRRRSPCLTGSER